MENLFLFIAFIPAIILWLIIGSIFYHMDKTTNIHHEGEPDPDCKDCLGLGIINLGDEHFECDCPCKMRTY